jgi:hypothetical protein
MPSKGKQDEPNLEADKSSPKFRKLWTKFKKYVVEVRRVCGDAKRERERESVCVRDRERQREVIHNETFDSLR